MLARQVACGQDPDQQRNAEDAAKRNVIRQVHPKPNAGAVAHKLSDKAIILHPSSGKQWTEGHDGWSADRAVQVQPARRALTPECEDEMNSWSSVAMSLGAVSSAKCPASRTCT